MPPKKISRKKPITPNSQITSALRLLSMRSRERQQALKNDNRTCAECGRKQSAAKGKECKVEAHHSTHRPDWKRIHTVIREELLQTPEAYTTLCKECHQLITEAEKRAAKELIAFSKK